MSLRMKRAALAAALGCAGCVGGISDATGDGTGTPAGAPAQGTPEAPTTPTTPATPATPASVTAAACKPGAKPASPARLWRLNDQQYSATMKSILGTDIGGTNPFKITTSSGRFANYAAAGGMPELLVDQLLSASDDAGRRLLASLKGSMPCLAAATPDAACVNDLLARVGKKAFRRPLTADELSQYANAVLAAEKTLNTQLALELGVEALLDSPFAVFRTELGAGTPDAAGRVKLTPYEVASAISYTLTSAPPDDMLMAAADAGQLGAPDVVRAHVVRLLGGAAARPMADDFIKQLFRYPFAANVFKDPKLYPNHRPDALIADTAALVQDLFAQRTGFLRNLLTTGSGYADANTQSSYGVTGLPATGPKQKVTYPAGQRAGMLTQPSFLAAMSDAEANAPIRRGRLVRENLLCQEIPPIPIGMVPQLPDLGPNATIRDRLAMHAMGTCLGCHRLMDPVGLTLEHYDHVGRWRTMEGGRPVVTTGAITGVGDQDIAIDGAVELGTTLAGLPAVRQCFGKQSFRYLMGRDETASDACALAAIDDALLGKDGDVVEAMSAVMASDAFLYRTARN